MEKNFNSFIVTIMYDYENSLAGARATIHDAICAKNAMQIAAAAFWQEHPDKAKEIWFIDVAPLGKSTRFSKGFTKDDVRGFDNLEVTWKYYNKDVKEF